EHENVFKDGNHAGGEHFIQRVHVCGDARDQAADGVFIEEPDVHVLEVAEDLAAKIEHDLEAGPLHEIGLGIFQAKAHQQQKEVSDAELRDANQRPRAEKTVKNAVVMPASGREILVNGGLGEERAQHVRAGLEDNGEQGDYDLPFIGP